MPSVSRTLSKNVQILQARASKSAIIGVIIAGIAVVLATILSSYFHYGEVSGEAIIRAQKSNPLLWFVDGMPFLFAFWGQYISSIMAYEAGAIIVDQTEELRARTVVLESKAMHDATHDPLTGLPNRILFRDRLEQALRAASPHDRFLAVLLLDMDNFKEINDTLGHYNGDKVLKQMGVRLRGVVQESETLARMGGDEFAVLMPDLKSEQDAELMAKKIQRAVSQPYMLEGMRLDVKVSIGASISPQHGMDEDTLIQRADVAMYVAKQEHSGFVKYSHKLDQYSPQRLTLVGELRHAIEKQELFLLFQPKVDARTGGINSVEALVRWHHPVHGIMPPDDFIPLAERTRMIKDLSRVVLQMIMRQTAEWLKGGTEISVAANLSAQDLLDPEMPDIMAGLLASWEVPAKNLLIEITETAIIVDPQRAYEIMCRLADIGIKFSIDDFGTGYSSLSYLKKLPVSEIKIDRSFVMDMMSNNNDEAIVQATIGLAHNLGMEVVAEGVETQETADRLRELGCDTLQGYLFSKPVSVNELQELMQRT